MRLLATLFLLFAVPAWSQSSQKPERKPLPNPEIRAFTDTYGALLESYVLPLEGADVIRAAIHGMLREIDPDGGEYLSEQDLRSDGPTAGVGVEFLNRNGAIVVSPAAGGPAFAAGLRFGDQIQTIDGVSVNANSSMRLSRLLRGQAGTEVRIGVYRPEGGKSFIVKVNRVEFVKAPASLTALPNNFCLLQIKTLSRDQLHSAFTQLRDAWGRSRFAGIVLDLRGNSGGPLTSAIALAAAFLPKDTVIVSLSGRGAENNKTYRAVTEDYAKGVIEDPLTILQRETRDLPLAVLVDEQTSSGSEIVVAALRDARRARLVGRPTFGSGGVQTIFPVPGAGAIKFTTAYWVSPAGIPLDRKPIQPDIVVENTNGDADVAAAISLLKEFR